MEIVFDYDFSKTKIDYCFINEPLKNSDITLTEIISDASKSIMIFDTNDYVLNSFLMEVEGILNDGSKIVIGLVSDLQIKNLKSKGVKGGFFRSTSEKCNVAIIIVDKKKCYVAFDENCIFAIKEKKSLNELYEYMNHIIWTKTSTEYCQGRFSVVKDSRLSVIKPILKHGITTGEHEFATKTMHGNSVLLEKEENVNKPALVLKKITENAYSDNDVLYINLFENYYYPIDNWESLIKARSLSDKTYAELAGKQIWLNGKTTTIKNEDSISNTIEKPVDEYKTFTPNFELLAKEYNGLCKTLHIHAKVNPMKVDKTYKLSDSYSKISNCISEINSNLDKIEKLLADKSTRKQIDTIRKEMKISAKVDLYNKFISNLDYGVDALKNTKNKFKEIKFDSSWIVPSELLGKLYTKDKKNYLALASEDKIEDAKEWLKENHIEAVLILGKED